MTTTTKTSFDAAEAEEMSFHHLNTLIRYKQQDEELAAAGLPSLEEMYQNCRKVRVHGAKKKSHSSTPPTSP